MMPAVDVQVSSTMSFDRRAEWDQPAVREQKLKVMRHSLMYSALEKGLGLVTEPFVEAVHCGFYDRDACGHLVMHPVPADSPEARTVVVTLSSRARPLEPAEPAWKEDS